MVRLNTSGRWTVAGKNICCSLVWVGQKYDHFEVFLLIVKKYISVNTNFHCFLFVNFKICSDCFLLMIFLNLWIDIRVVIMLLMNSQNYLGLNCVTCYYSMGLHYAGVIWSIWPSYDHLNGLVQNCSNSIANAQELLQFCTKPSILWSLLQSFSQ